MRAMPARFIAHGAVAPARANGRRGTSRSETRFARGPHAFCLTEPRPLSGWPDCQPGDLFRRVPMGATTTTFQGERAPCGRIVAGDHFQDQDDDCLVSDEWFYACGCRIIHHEYHDGTVSRRVVRHDGKVLTDQLEAEHEHHQ